MEEKEKTLEKTTLHSNVLLYIVANTLISNRVFFRKNFRIFTT